MELLSIRRLFELINDFELNESTWKFDLRKKKSLLWPGASQRRIYYHRMWVQLSSTCSNFLKWPNGELLVAVNHNQLWTMASETVDPIDWSHPPPYTGQYPLSSTYCILQCGLGCKSQDLLHLESLDHATFGMPACD